jgi:hypothetical protein
MTGVSVKGTRARGHRFNRDAEDHRRKVVAVGLIRWGGPYVPPAETATDVTEVMAVVFVSPTLSELPSGQYRH